MSFDDDLELPADVAALLDSERDIPQVSAGQRERVAGRLASVLATSSGLAVLWVWLRWGQRILGSKWTLLGIATIGVSVAGAVFMSRTPSEEMRRAIPHEPVSAAPVEGSSSDDDVDQRSSDDDVDQRSSDDDVDASPASAAGSSAWPDAELARSPSSLAGARSPASALVRTDAALARERALLRRARDSLRAGDLRAARAALAAHDSQFPDGRLASERQTLLLRIGDKQAAP